ncbi:MAG: MgtC/SapB family protein [Chloroflexi bacterium]|nr:MgtC/SapB family protein [Chloroflexota bacterium]MBU1748259.1 MgtC/SapB family protein [Chloroflexota bacterium]
MIFVGLEQIQFQIQILAYISLAMLLGAAIGFEREWADKPAGLRTHMLVAGAAALFVALGDVVVRSFSTDLGGGLVQSDPVRVIQAVVTGVSFLGAGTILRLGSAQRVEGLTTAASILFAAAVGVSVALSQFVLAVGATGLVLITLRGVGGAQRWLARRSSENHET